jgi:hypothetical protein
MSAPLSFARHQVLASIVQQMTQRVNELFAFADALPASSLAALEAEAARLTQDCLLPAVQVAVEEQRQRVEAAPNAASCHCGRAGHYKGVARRTLLTQAGVLTFRRAYYYCLACQAGYYPLDAALGLGPGQFSAGVQAGVCRLGAELPFERAAATYTALTGRPISPREVARLTEARGAAWEEQLAGERAALLQGAAAPPAAPPPAQDARCWAVALDAAKVCFRDGWHEIKVGVVGRARPTPRPGRAAGSWRPGARVEEQSYIAHVGSMSGAAARLYAEVVRRGCDPGAERVLCLGDGAPSIWNEFATHFPQRVEILDWYHAVEHLWAAGNGLYGEGTAGAATWVAARKEELWAGQVAAVVAALQAAAAESRGQAAADEVHYFTANAGRMAYAAYRAAGYPVGSGVVESGCKQVVGQRAKGAGMRWSAAGVQRVLTLRATVLSGCWEQTWAARSGAAKAA